MKNTAIFMICLTMCICFGFAVLYKIDMYRMENNEPVVFSTWGTEYSPEEETDEVINDKINNNINDNVVYFEIEDDTVNPRGLNAKIINDTDNSIAYLDYYRIEKKIGNKWCYYDYLYDLGSSWNDMTYIIEPSAFAEVGFYWPEMYGELGIGEYRIVKEYYDNADTSNRVHYLYGEFELH